MVRFPALPVWVLIFGPILAFVAMLATDCGWPSRPYLDFQQENTAKKTWKAWTFSTYSPHAQTLTLSGKLLPYQSGNLTLQASLADGKIMGSIPLNPAANGVAAFSLDLPLENGHSQLTLKVLTMDGPVSFRIQQARLVQTIWNARKCLLFATLVLVIAATVACGRWLGFSGWDLWFFCPIPAFLGLTATASILSMGHHLNGLTWAGSLIVLSSGALVLFRRKRPSSQVEKCLGWPEWLAILALTVPLFIGQMTTPVSKGDDQMYHGPRAGYWLTNASIWPFPAHDERLTVFAAGGDMIFAFGAMTARTEQAGKFVVFLAWPLTLLAMLGLLRSLKIHRWLALGAMIGLGTTPILFSATRFIKPDLWLVLFTIIAVYWTLRTLADRKLPMLLPCGLAGGAVAAAIAVKWTALPLVVLLPCLIWRNPHWLKRTQVVAATFCLALALDSAGPLLVLNTRAHGHPLGSQEMRATHHPEPGWHSLVVQGKRLPFLLFGVPVFPTVEAQQWLENHLQQAAVQIGATENLGYEGLWAWPGVFKADYPFVDRRFSLTWLFGLVGVGATLAAFPQLRKRGELLPFFTVAGLAVLLTVAIITQVRWQVAAELPERFLTFVLPLFWLVLAWAMDRLPSQKRVFQIFGGCFLALHAVPFFLQSGQTLLAASQKEWRVPVKPTPSELTEAANKIPPGSDILLFGEENTHDYQLFHPREGFASRVRSWGRATFKVDAFESAIRPETDAVVFARDDDLHLGWTLSIDAKPFIQALEARPDFTRIITRPPVVVFLRKTDAPWSGK